MEKEIELQFPLTYSSFKRKANAAYDGDPNGDFVMAEDINELQFSVERIEQALDLEALSKTVVEELNSKINKEDISDFGSPLFVYYGGSSINAYQSIEERINAFSYIPYVMVKRENSAQFTYFIEQVKKSGTTVFGILSCQNMSLGEIETAIELHKSEGFDGIALSAFDYADGWTRTDQNDILSFIHTRNMIALFNGDKETLLQNKPHANNPTQEDLKTTPSDIYVANNIFISDGKKREVAGILADVFQLNKIQQEKQIRVFVEDTGEPSTDLYLYGKMMATLYNFDGYNLTRPTHYALNEKIERYVHGFELGKWKVQTPVFVEEEGQVYRSLSKGKIIFNKMENRCYMEGVQLNPNIYTWADKQIPGQAVDLATAEYTEAVTEGIVEAINRYDSLIHFSKIDGLGDSGFSQEAIKEHVVRAINSSPAAIKKNPPDGYDKIAGNDYIHGGMIHHIDAGSITSGSLSVEQIKANVIEAVNAHVGNAVIDAAKIGELTANHIQAHVVDAINIYAHNASIDKAVIDSAVIGKLSSDHISSAVIEAINVSVENVVIDAAKIGELTVDNIKAAMVEAIKISAGSGEFDHLQAAIIDAINASIEKAFINGALIKKGTINEAHIFEATILDAFIHSLDAGKIRSGSLDTSLVRLEGENAHLRLVNNRLQILDKREEGGETTYFERVVLGDVNDDGSVYGMRIRSADGESILFDEHGLTKEGLTDGIVDHDKLAPDAVHNENVLQGSLTGDRLVVDAITGREIMAKEITGDHIKSFSITASDAVFAEGTILAADIGKAQINDAHIDTLDAKSIKTGVLSADRIQVGFGTQFEEGYSPDELRQEIENRIPYRVEIISTNGIIFKNGQITTTLKAKVYKGAEDITNQITSSRFNWLRVGADGEADEAWNEQHKGMREVEIDQNDVFRRATFLCEVLDS